MSATGSAESPGANNGECGRTGCINAPAEGSDWCTPCNQEAYDRMAGPVPEGTDQ